MKAFSVNINKCFTNNKNKTKLISRSKVNILMTGGKGENILSQYHPSVPKKKGKRKLLTVYI